MRPPESIPILGKSPRSTFSTPSEASGTVVWGSTGEIPTASVDGLSTLSYKKNTDTKNRLGATGKFCRVSDRSVKPTPYPNTPPRQEHHKIPRRGVPSETYSYFPAPRPEHAGLALEALCPSTLGNADAADAAECFGALLICCTSCCALLYCCTHSGKVLLEIASTTTTTINTATAVRVLQHAAAVVVHFRVLQQHCPTVAHAGLYTYPGSALVVETTSTNAVYTIATYVPGTRYYLTYRTTSAVPIPGTPH